MLRSVLASTFTSLLAVASARAGESTPDPALVATAEMEATLAKRPAVYLVLDPTRRVLEIRARGTVLDTIQLRGIELISQQPLFGGRHPVAPPMPAIWTVTDGPGDRDREVLEPESLRPAPKPDQDDSDAPSADAATPTPTPPPRETPSSYRATLGNGWDLWITEELPSQGRWGLFTAAVRDGLARLRGQGQDLPPAVTLAMTREDAQRLHHLLRSGTPILVASDIE